MDSSCDNCRDGSCGPVDALRSPECCDRQSLLRCHWHASLPQWPDAMACFSSDRRRRYRFASAWLCPRSSGEKWKLPVFDAEIWAGLATVVSCISIMPVPAISSSLPSSSSTFSLRLDKFNFERQMVGNFDEAGGMHVVIRAESGDALQDRGAGNSAIEEEVENAGIRWNAVVGRSLAYIDGDLDGFACLQHGTSCCT